MGDLGASEARALGRGPWWRTLRGQLLLGLAVILPVAALSVGLITHWATRQQLAEGQVEHARMLGKALAALASTGLSGTAEDRASLQMVVSQLGGGAYPARFTVVDRALRPLGVAVGAWPPGQAGAELLRRAIATEQQLVMVGAPERGSVRVATPVYAPRLAAVAGAVHLELPLSVDVQRPPLLFWLLMAANSVVLLLFVGVVITRYVARPIEALQRAASRVAAGDLSGTLGEEGAYEIASLAASFNGMVGALREQLERLDQQRRSLIRSEKLASVGHLAAGVAHEVGNPLQAIIGFTDLLLADDLDAQQREEFLQRTQREAQRIHAIIGGLLDYARPVEDHAAAVPLAAAVEEAVALVVHQRRFRHVVVEQQGLAALPAVAASQQRVVQVLVNLLLNAGDAIERDGRVVITGDAPPGAPVALRVSNNGRPIVAAHRSRIFEPFFTTKDPGQGTGLGLSVAQSIAALLGGSLELDPEVAATTFVLRLPRWREP
ncbi:MAG: HAMP domain-containing histidine kinase [Proteobacteria bacterium]|nr:HAMP domain-containing histidine kinase [Pseudomonadota bacterium]